MGLKTGLALGGLVALAGSAAVLGGCSRAGGQAAGSPGMTMLKSAPVPHGFKPLPLHHFRPGDTWVYHSTGGGNTAETRITVLSGPAHSPVDGDCLVLQAATTQAGKISVSRGAFQQDATGSQFLCGMAASATEPIHWGIRPIARCERVASPLYPGLVWAGALRTDDGREQFFQATAGFLAPVTVPAGSFKAFPTFEKTAYGQGKKIVRQAESHVWIVPALGLPALIQSGSGAHRSVQELVSYHFST
jgi:hypothetical protein